MAELDQRNGKNWRKINIVDDGILFEATIANQFSHKRLDFDKTGFRKNDYERLIVNENRSGQQLSQGMLILAVVILIFLPAAVSSGTTEGSSSLPVTVASFISLAGIVTILFMVILRQPRKVTIKKIFFASGGFLTFYYRNTQEADQVDEFIGEIDKALTQYSKKRFLLKLEKKEKGLMTWLDSLHEKGLFEHDEYLKHVKEIQKIDKAKKDSE